MKPGRVTMATIDVAREKANAALASWKRNLDSLGGNAIARANAAEHLARARADVERLLGLYHAQRSRRHGR